MRARASARLGAAALAACVGACNGAPGDEGGGGGETEATTGDPDDAPLPLILDPAAPILEITADRRAPLVFQVGGVIPGETRVLLDGRPLGLLADDGPIGSLTADTLTLALHGALLQGAHTLALENPGGDEDRRSREVTISVRPSPPRTWSAAVSEPVIAAGASLFVDGQGDDALLAVIDAGDGGAPTARIFRASAGAWAGPPQALALDGYVVDPAEWTPRAAFLLRPAADGGEPRLRAAWAVGLPAATIVAGEGPLAAAASIVAVPALDAPGPVREPLEWSAFDRLRLAGDALLVELIARVDAELPRPGDRRLLRARWPAGAPAPLQVDEIGGAARVDLDSLGQAVAADGGPVDRRALRVAGVHPGLLEFTGAGAPTLTLGVPTALLAATPQGMIGLATVNGAFLSRTFFAADPERGPSLTLIDARGYAAATVTPAVALDDPPIGPPSPAVLDGRPIALLPFGDAAPLRLLTSDGALLRDRPLEGVYCDRVALVPAAAADDTLGFACLRHGELRWGALTSAPEG